MNDNESILIGLLDQVLGPGEMGSRTNRKYKCPFHASEKLKFEIDVRTDEEGLNRSHCWVCGEKFKTLASLFRKLNVSQKMMDQLKSLITHNDTKQFKYTKFSGVLPEDYIFLPNAKPNDIASKHARVYLKKRGVTIEDIYKWNIGYCGDGQYEGRIIIPSYDAEGKINFFAARSWDEDTKYKYVFPEVSRDIIFNELNINWNEPITLVEGALDMTAVKRNVIPLLGKSITENLMKRLVSSKVKKIYMCLDPDALKVAIRHCETLLNYGKRLYLIELPNDKDPNKTGFENFTKIIQKASPLTLGKIMELKMFL